MASRASQRATPKAMTPAQFERLLAISASLAMLVFGVVAGVAALMVGRVILAPVCFAIVIGLMFGPVADLLEKRGLRPGFSAAIVVLLFIGMLAAAVMLFSAPLSEWIARGPQIWAKLRAQLMSLKGPIETLSSVQEQLKSAFGAEEVVTVEVQDGGPVQDLATTAPSLLADVLLFLASLYFFLATRKQIQVAVLSLCFSRRVRWRAAHVFRDVESRISTLLLSAAVINAGLGVATAVVLWLLGAPSPLLWGALAAMLNFIPYVGQAVMIVILLAVGFGTQTTLLAMLMPVIAYAVLNLVADQIVFPQFVGRVLTLNPFVILVATAFWIWIWGPAGGFVAVPSLLVLQSIVLHILPSRPLPRHRHRASPAEALPAPTAAAPKRAPRKPALPTPP
ncbi:MAG: AI-2E family transporter [Devosia sp.]